MAEQAALQQISDPDDPRIAAYLGLRDHRVRQLREQPGGDMAGLFMAEGLTVIERALLAGRRLDSVLVDARRSGPVVGLVGSGGVVYAASPEVLLEVCGREKLRDPIACFVRPAPVNVVELLSRSHTVAALEGVANPTNMGVITRCAAGLGIDAVVLDPTCCDPLYRRAVRVSMGEVFAVPHARLAAFPEGFSTLTEAGFTIAALTPQSGAVDVVDYRRTPGDRLAILLGSEGPGLSDGAVAAADLQLRIPMSAGVDSINVGSAAAVAFHVLRARSGQ